MANIRKGDLVQVITGPTPERGGDRGKQGHVIGVQADKNRVIVEGVNFVTKHVRVGQTQRGTKTGGIETMEAPIHVSNIALVDPATKMPARVGFTVETDDRGKTVRVRYFKKSKRVETKKSVAARGTKDEKPAASEKSAVEKPAKAAAKATAAPATAAPATTAATKAKTPKKDAVETAEKDAD
jgi:large subunit ribosomal protein L24